MPRAYRYYSPGCIWHITHRCHQRERVQHMLQSDPNDGTRMTP
ncbi:MAG: hypothetical protein NTV22_07105 [bacterium]|nr:hypothetical protein [bacterium]